MRVCDRLSAWSPPVFAPPSILGKFPGHWYDSLLTIRTHVQFPDRVFPSLAKLANIRCCHQHVCRTADFDGWQIWQRIGPGSDHSIDPLCCVEANSQKL